MSDVIQASELFVRRFVTTEQGKLKEELLEEIGKLGRIEIRRVDVRPQTGESGVIYLVPSEKTETDNVYDEYLWINSAWELIGTTAVDLSNVAKSVNGKTGDVTLTGEDIEIRDGNVTVAYAFENLDSRVSELRREFDETLPNKQDTITDLADIRLGAEYGATAVQMFELFDRFLPLEWPDEGNPDFFDFSSHSFGFLPIDNYLHLFDAKGKDVCYIDKDTLSVIDMSSTTANGVTFGGRNFTEWRRLGEDIKIRKVITTENRHYPIHICEFEERAGEEKQYYLRDATRNVVRHTTSEEYLLVLIPKRFEDLIIRATVLTDLRMRFADEYGGNLITKHGDDLPSEAGEYLITVTRTDATEAYVRVIKLDA